MLSALLVLVAPQVVSAPSSLRPCVLIDESHVRLVPSTGPIASTPPAPSSPPPPAPAVCLYRQTGRQGEPVPGGGTLFPFVALDSANIDGSGRSVFHSYVNGSLRNQGVFTSDGFVLQPIAVGCGPGGGGGAGGGLGDTTPVGGTFAGFFAGTFFVPATNRAGDVVFLADVDAGSVPRALFVYRRASGTLAKVAAMGDASPAGGMLGQVGMGSINDAGDVVFLALGASGPSEQILRWSNGVLSKVAAVGDPAPLGGAYTHVGGEMLGLPDGTTLPVGPLPDINVHGDVAFRAVTSGVAERGIVLVRAGVPQWYVGTTDASPLGGNYVDIVAAHLSDAGEIAFYSDVEVSPGNYSGGWVAGRPGAWRKVIQFLDPLDGGSIVSLAFSRNPQQSISSDGTVLVWARTHLPSGIDLDEELLVDAFGSQTLVARQGDPTTHLGFYGTLDPWPSRLAMHGTFGAWNGSQDVHFVFDECAPAPSTYCAAKVNSLGCTPAIGFGGVSSASATSGFAVTVSNVLNNTSGILIMSVSGRATTAFGGGTLCLRAPILRSPVLATGGTSGPANCSGSVTFDLNAFAAGFAGGVPHPLLSVPGTVVDCQLWSRDAGFAPPNNVSLSDALEYVVGL